MDHSYVMHCISPPMDNWWRTSEVMFLTPHRELLYTFEQNLFPFKKWETTVKCDGNKSTHTTSLKLALHILGNSH